MLTFTTPCGKRKFSRYAGKRGPRAQLNPPCTYSNPRRGRTARLRNGSSRTSSGKREAVAPGRALAGSGHRLPQRSRLHLRPLEPGQAASSFKRMKRFRGCRRVSVSTTSGTPAPPCFSECQREDRLRDARSRLHSYHPGHLHPWPADMQESAADAMEAALGGVL